MTALTRLLKELAAPNADAKRIVKDINKLADSVETVTLRVKDFLKKEKAAIQSLDREHALNVKDGLKDALKALEDAYDKITECLPELDDLVG